MADDIKTGGFKGLVQWASTRPQSYVVYVAALLLIYGVMFYAGMLVPKKAPPAASPVVIAPHN